MFICFVFFVYSEGLVKFGSLVFGESQQGLLSWEVRFVSIGESFFIGRVVYRVVFGRSFQVRYWIGVFFGIFGYFRRKDIEVSIRGVWRGVMGLFYYFIVDFKFYFFICVFGAFCQFLVIGRQLRWRSFQTCERLKFIIIYSAIFIKKVIWRKGRLNRDENFELNFF